VVTDPDAARPLQDDLIRRLAPEDNVVGNPAATGVEREPGPGRRRHAPRRRGRAPPADDYDDAAPF
jgi:hypothetical protein